MRISLLLFLFVFQFTLSQDFKPGTVFFSSGNTLEGLVDVTYKKVVVKKEMDGRSIPFGHMAIDSVQLTRADSITTYVFKKYLKKILPMLVIVSGEAELLSYTYPQSYDGAGGGTYYYLGRKGELKVTRVSIKGVIDKSFKKSTAKFFSDCPELVEKIETKEFGRDDIKQIVLYYNSNCK